MELMTSMGYSPDPELWTDDCKREEDSGNDVSDDHLRRSTGVQGQNRRTFRVVVEARQWGNRIVVEGLTASTTVAALKSAVQGKEGFPSHEQRLTYEGKRIEDDWTLGESNIDRDATIDLYLEQSGC